MALKKDNYPMVGFRYEVSIVPDMGVNKSDFNKSKGSLKGKIKQKWKENGKNFIAAAASSAVSAIDKASFSEISGVSVSFETSPISDGKGGTKEVPRKADFSPLVLKRGLTGTQSQLLAWVVASMLLDDKKELLIVTKTVIVNLLSDQGTPLASWIFNGAYPIKWSVSGLKAMSNDLIIEELVLRYDTFYPVFYGI